jgi:hypothetical protein
LSPAAAVLAARRLVEGHGTIVHIAMLPMFYTGQHLTRSGAGALEVIRNEPLGDILTPGELRADTGIRSFVGRQVWT